MSKTVVYKNEYVVTTSDGIGKRSFMAFSIESVATMLGIKGKKSIDPSGNKNEYTIKDLGSTPGHQSVYTVRVINHNF